MERKEFLDLCRECAMLKSGAYDIKQNVPERLQVTYGGINYYPYGYELSFMQNGKVRHIAILHELKAHSIMHCALERVKRSEQ